MPSLDHRAGLAAMKGGSAIKESGPSCWPCVNLELMNNINTSTVFGSTLDRRGGGG